MSLISRWGAHDRTHHDACWRYHHECAKAHIERLEGDRAATMDPDTKRDILQRLDAIQKAITDMARSS